MSTENWIVRTARPWTIAETSAEAERLGYDGIAVNDSQNLRADCFVTLAIAAVSTHRLKLGTAVTNPFTRHAATLASAFASLQAVSGGRAIVGIGRGDSSLAHVGLAPAPLPYFAKFLESLQRYLSGEEVPFGDLPTGGLADVAGLDLHDAPESSRLRWFDDAPPFPKVPVEVSASGPKVIELAAKLADRVTFGVGADPARLRWAVDIARRARADAGLDVVDGTLGSYVTIAVDDDVDRARYLIGGRLAGFVRFSAMHGKAVGPVGDDREIIEGLTGAYSMEEHGQVGSMQTKVMTDEFADRFGVLGPASHCIERLQELSELGITRLVLIPPGSEVDPEGEVIRRIAEEVLPALA